MSIGAIVVGSIVGIIVGLIAGALAKLVMPGDDRSSITTILIGIAGAVVSGYLSVLFGLSVGIISITIVAAIGAIIPLTIYLSMQQRRTQQRSEEQLRPRQSEEQRQRTGEEVGREYEHAARGQRSVEEAAERGLRERETKGIFISYRRDETAGYAGRIADSFDEHFGADRVFRDIDSIEPGLDFAEAMERAVGSAEVLIAVIGRNWLTATDTAGRKRLENPNDYVRMEIAAALKRNIRVVPLLVQGASMPSADELPDDLAPLARRNAFELHDTSWRDDVRRLTSALQRVIER